VYRLLFWYTDHAQQIVASEGDELFQPELVDQQIVAPEGKLETSRSFHLKVMKCWCWKLLLVNCLLHV